MTRVVKDTCPTGDWRRKIAIVLAIFAYALLHAPSSTEPAVADGETRTLTFMNNHTHETGSFTFLVNGAYDPATLDKLNWFMRDWRLNEQVKMDPHLFDIIWDVYQESGSGQPIDVLSAYRSPQTNAMLRRRSRQVAERSQHMQGKAIDAHFMDIRPAPIRDIAMRKQEGGVGFYPIGSTPWIHIDSGTVRYWPRMNRSALARLFPDGKTVFIPSDGQPMERYADAKAMIESRGGEVQTASTSNGLFSWLFGGARGGGADDEEETGGVPIAAGGRGAPPVMAAGGRGASISSAVAGAAPEASPEATTPVELAASPEPTAQATVDDGSVRLSSEEAAEPPEAPVPPHRPTEFLTAFDPTPFPPKRPPELTVLAPATGSASAANDLIAAMLKPETLSSTSSDGTRFQPKNALALAEATGDKHEGNADLLARAAALSPPPLPPRRPRFSADGVSSVEKTPAPPRRPTKTSFANPYGSLVVDAFDSGYESTAPKSLFELKSIEH